jgi:hypothetical protein
VTSKSNRQKQRERERRRQKQRQNSAPPKLAPNVSSLSSKWGPRVWQVIVALGVLTLVPTYLNSWITGDLTLKFDGSEGDAYAFTLTNTAPMEQRITSFRVKVPRNQAPTYITTKPVLAEQGPNGTITLPGGNEIYIPAVEFTQLDGQKIAAHSTLDFHIPPLSSRVYAQPQALMVYVSYIWEPSNSILRFVGHFAAKVGLTNENKIVRYVVVKNVWDVSPTADPTEALKELCRDDDQIDNSITCASLHHG